MSISVWDAHSVLDVSVFHVLSGCVCFFTHTVGLGIYMYIGFLSRVY